MARIIVLAVFISLASVTTAQNVYNKALKELNSEQQQFKTFAASLSTDENISGYLQNFGKNGVNKILVSIRKMNSLNNDEKAQAVKTLNSLLRDVRLQVTENKLNIYRIPSLLATYESILNSILRNQAAFTNLELLDWRSLQVLSNAFWQYDSKKALEGLSTYKRLVRTPQHVLPYLEKYPNYSLRDSLVYHYITHYPSELVSYLRKKTNSRIPELLSKHPNPYAQQVSLLMANLNATEIIPFTELLANNVLSVDSLLDIRKKVTEYYQLLVNTIIENQQAGQASDFQKALQAAVYDKAMDFYAKEINALHSSPDAVRFASIKDLRPQDIYYIIVSCDNELYTSSYLGLYRCMMKFFEKNPSDSLLELVDYDQFRKFLRIASGYNTLSDFMNRMPPESRWQVVHDFISGFDGDAEEEEAIKDAVDVADALQSFIQDTTLRSQVGLELVKNLNTAKKQKSWLGVRLYDILYQLYMGLEGDGSSPVAAALKAYETLSIDELRNDKGEINQLILFFGDEDGKMSFQNFMGVFKDTTHWIIEKNESWVQIRSNTDSGVALSIYANLPLDYETERDIAAQNALSQYLATQNIRPSIVIHRGHSYHLKHTLKHLNPSVKLAVLGSCGGYNNALKIVTANPDVQIIASKQVGAMAVNDPLLQSINTRISSGKALHWPEIWEQLAAKLKTNSAAGKIFSEYVPPYKNISLFVIKLFNYTPDIESVVSR